MAVDIISGEFMMQLAFWQWLALFFFSNKYAIQLKSSKIELIHVNNSISYVSVSMSRFDRFFPIVVAFLCVNNHATQMFFGVFTKDDLCGMTKYRR